MLSPVLPYQCKKKEEEKPSNVVSYIFSWRMLNTNTRFWWT
jgi:hypothetical protein